MVLIDEHSGLFTLHTRNTAYQMKVDRYHVLLHTYYGPHIDDCDLSSLIQCGGRSFSPNSNEAGASRDYSLDVMPKEETIDL